MSTSTISCPLTPRSKDSRKKSTPSEMQSPYWTIPPPDWSNSGRAHDQKFPVIPNTRKRRPSTINLSSKKRESANPMPSLPVRVPRENRVVVNFINVNPLLEETDGETPLATRLQRDSECRELERTDVFSPKDRTTAAADIATTPIRTRSLPGSLGESTSPFVKCLLSNTPAKLPSKISVASPGGYDYNNPPKLRRLSVQGDSAEDFKRRLSYDDNTEKWDPHMPTEKVCRPLPNIQGEVEFEVISSPVSPLRDHDLMFIPEEPEVESSGDQHAQLLTSSPIHDIHCEDPFMVSSKRRRLSN
ncbi:hypothetical protein K493DRAFT_315228 [Basidiobolus meristosporus CBS 931.73]|uniref:Uncharacterized protein n=1 Tax=Basidiobolus meristosporus CBS 931.73 TaxID=1314790 RepID=A0A1Y1YAN7_9FUNG|nr:hypothetical protein K493DRAFT_315228 [Basidiobolus meristosporus CBS 931.73]|eukprot:ORX95028.1 hypothetical protein K493DRAFT_315228 [Basidiobolus meristosporus CBS 931.73]